MEGQQRSLWCWAAVARMFAKHYYPTISYTQGEAVTDVMGSAVNEGGNVLETQQAISFYISNITNASLQTSITDHRIYDEATLLQFLNDGNVLCIGRGLYRDTSNSNTRYGGHMILIYGYTIVGDDYYYLIHDPEPVNQGNSHMLSYEMLCNGQNPQDGEKADNGVWVDTVVLATSYSSNTIPCDFN